MPHAHRTLILSRADAAALAAPADYIAAVESAFRALATGATTSLPVGHVPGDGGAFHIKAAAGGARVALKVNSNFPANPQRNGLPTIQGCLLLADAADGRLLAVMDSIEVTAQRTAAASAVAARQLARRDARRLAFVGGGLQVRYHLAALLALDEFRFASARCFDTSVERATAWCALAAASGLTAQVADDVAAACRDADVIVTCTPSAVPFLDVAHVAPGAFVAAVGADNPGKNELVPTLLARARVVPDVLAQAIAMGDLRAALAAGAMTVADVHAELADVVAGAAPGRTQEEEIFVFDSTGTAIEDLAAAQLLYARAVATGAGTWIDLNGIEAA